MQQISGFFSVHKTCHRVQLTFDIISQDIVTRYASATGHYCPRKFGWAPSSNRTMHAPQIANMTHACMPPCASI